MTPAERSLRSRLGGLTTAARHDAREYTAPARAAFGEKFYAGIPADLPADERDRRATAARKAHFTRLALASVRSRSKRKATPTGENVGVAQEARHRHAERPPAA